MTPEFSYIIIQLTVVSTSVAIGGRACANISSKVHAFLTTMCTLKSDCFNRIFNVNSNTYYYKENTVNLVLVKGTGSASHCDKQ